MALVVVSRRTWLATFLAASTLTTLSCAKITGLDDYALTSSGSAAAAASSSAAGTGGAGSTTSASSNSSASSSSGGGAGGSCNIAITALRTNPEGRETDALTANGVYRWGQLVASQDTPSPTLDPLAVGIKDSVIGGYHLCLLTTAGALSCWGQNTSGELGDGTTSPNIRPGSGVNIPGKTFLEASASDGTTCAITNDRSVYCWGTNDSANLGTGVNDANPHPNPTDVGIGTDNAEIRVSSFGACVRKTSGDVYCWGHDNGDGAVGLGNDSNYHVPTQLPISGATKVAMGGSSGCVLYGVAPSTHVACWGIGPAGHPVPTDVSAFAGAIDIAVGGSGFACVVKGTGGVVCQGNNNSDQLGDTDTSVFGPTQPFPSGVAGIVAGFDYACDPDASGTIYCWGSNFGDALGVGKTYAQLDMSPTPLAVSFCN